MGDKVKSPDAVNLPLDLVIAILKDSKGNIKPPDVPVAGPLNDPSVSIGKLIWYAISSLIKSIVAAPFNLLGGALGGGDGDGGGGGMPAITFASGATQLSPEGTQQITKLATTLVDRPALGLRLVGVPAPSGADEAALGRLVLRERLAAEDGGVPPTDARYAKAIAAWYAEAHPADATRPAAPSEPASGTAAPSGPPVTATGSSGDAVEPPRRRRGIGRGGTPRRTGPVRSTSGARRLVRNRPPPPRRATGPAPCPLPGPRAPDAA